MESTRLLLLLSMLVGTLAYVAGCATADSPVFWHEAEKYATAPAPRLGKTVDDRAPASGGKVLYTCLGQPGNVVTYNLKLPTDIPDATMLMRYARLHWRDTMVPGEILVELEGAGEPVKAKLTFDNTGGWGRKQQHYGFAAARLGDLKAGKLSVKLTVTKEADQNTDGFFIVPGGVSITAKELARLVRLQITSHGYMGMLSNSTVIRQTGGARLSVAARNFAGDPGQVKATVTDGAGKKTKLRPVSPDAAADESGAVVLEFVWPELPDGDYSLQVACAAPKAAIRTDLVLAGQLMASLTDQIGAIEKFAKSFATSDSPHVKQCLADLEHAVEYLKDGHKKLNLSAPERSAWEEGLAEHEGITNAEPVVASLRKALAQTQETVNRLKAGKDPYSGRTGEFRRAFRSDKDNVLVPYRVLVPDNYFTTRDKAPFILMLHGGGGDENYWPEMEGGILLKMLNKAGYLAVMPAWHSRRRPKEVDVPQLLKLALKEYDRIDPDRVYCTGISMGGFGTYWLTTTYPEKFAAGCCVSGTGSPDLAAKLKNVPLLILQGGSDTVVPPKGAKAVAAKLKELGQTVEIHVFPTHGHNYFPEQYMKLTLDFFDKHRRAKK